MKKWETSTSREIHIKIEECEFQTKRILWKGETQLSGKTKKATMVVWMIIAHTGSYVERLGSLLELFGEV